ncbi:MAG: hypothetical protein WC965_01050 [Thiohalomonadaceae bacterium]
MELEQNLLFFEFVERVEYTLIDRYGKGLDEVHEYPLRSWYKRGTTVGRAADAIAREEGLE